MKEPVKLIDSRNQKVYEGYLTTMIQLGHPVKIALPDGKHEFVITPLQRFLHVGNHYWLIDKSGIKFTLIHNAA